MSMKYLLNLFNKLWQLNNPINHRGHQFEKNKNKRRKNVVTDPKIRKNADNKKKHIFLYIVLFFVLCFIHFYSYLIVILDECDLILELGSWKFSRVLAYNFFFYSNSWMNLYLFSSASFLIYSDNLIIFSLSLLISSDLWSSFYNFYSNFVFLNSDSYSYRYKLSYLSISLINYNWSLNNYLKNT